MLTTSRIRSLCEPQMVEATSPTTPWLFWKDAVLLAAHRAVEGLAKEELDRFLPTSEWRDRLRLWYNCGEPVWMAAKSLADVATECAKDLVPGAGEELRAAIRRSLGHGPYDTEASNTNGDSCCNECERGLPCECEDAL